MADSTTPAEQAVQAIADNLSKPKKAEIDGQQIEQFDLEDQIAAAKFVASAAASRSRKLGVRFCKMVAGGGIR